MIKVNYSLKEFQNTTLFKFFRTEEEVKVFKSQHPDYIFIGDK